MNKEEITGSPNVTERNYKDTIFRMIFREPQELLSLYNGLNNTDYSDPSALQIVTLENAVYMNVKNDLACIVDCRLSLYEQQSSVNPNMPLRNLIYVVKEYQGMITKRSLYSQYVSRVQLYAKTMPLHQAVENAVDECIKEGILADFLTKNRAEAIAMCIFEYDEERELALYGEAERELGREEGLKEGYENGLAALVASLKIYLPDFKTLFETIKKNKCYETVTEEQVRKYFN